MVVGRRLLDVGQIALECYLPAVFYMHPWEIDPGQPRIEAPWRSRFRHYTNLHRTESRLSQLLKDFRWGRMDEVFLARQIDGKVVLREAWGIA